MLTYHLSYICTAHFSFQMQSICGQTTLEISQFFVIWLKENHVPNPGFDTWSSNEVERKIQIRTDTLK